MTKFIGALAVLGGVTAGSLFMISPAQAGCGRIIRTSYSSPTYVKEIVTPVAVPVIVPVIVPAFSFQYTPPPSFAIPAAAPCQAPCAGIGAGVYPAGASAAQPAYGGAYGASLPTTGPYASPYIAQQPGQYQPGYQAGMQQPLQQPAPVQGGVTDEQLRMITQAVIAEMQKGGAAGVPATDNGPPPVTGFAPAGSPSGPTASTPGLPAPTGSVPGGPTGPGGFPSVTPPYPSIQPPAGGFPPTNAAPQSGRPLPNSIYAVNAIAALSRNCAYCHTGGGSRGDAILFVQPGILNPDAPFRSIEREMSAGRMPPRNSQFRLAPEEYSTIMAWLSGQ